MGVQLKLLPNFSLQLNGSKLIDEAVFSQGPIWVNKELVIHGDNNRPLTINGETVLMEVTVKMAPVDQYMPVECVVLTSVAYEPKYANDVFTFKETVTEMRQHYEKEKSRPRERNSSNQCRMPKKSAITRHWLQHKPQCLPQKPVTYTW